MTGVKGLAPLIMWQKGIWRLLGGEKRRKGEKNSLLKSTYKMQNLVREGSKKKYSLLVGPGY